MLARRGIALETALITLVIFGAIFLVIALLYKSMIDGGRTEFSEKECQASLLLTRGTENLANIACVQVADNPLPIHCTRRFLTVDAQRVTDAASTEAIDVTWRYSLGSCPEGTASCLPQKAVAQEMARCWSLFFEGEAPVFQQVDQAWDFGNNERACFVCAEISLRPGAGISGFKDFLKQAELPAASVRKSSARTYHDLLAGNPSALCGPDVKERGPSCWEAMASIDEGKSIDQDALAGGTTHAIVLLRRGLEDPDTQCVDIGMKDYPTITVQAIPVADVGRVCEKLVT